MRRAALALAAAGLATGGPASARPVGFDPYAGPWAEGVAAPALVAGERDGQGVGPFFYPSGYDPQYGSEGRLPDAASFAAGYGCRSIWNAKTGRRAPACN